MSAIIVSGDVSGSVTLQAPATAGSTVINLPSTLGNTGTSSFATTDSSGNLGLGATPKAWAVGSRGFQVGSYTALSTATGGDSNLTSNAYLSAAGVYTAIASLGSSRYQLDFGAHKWYTAASGTAGNTISFTQAMTLDASGNLGIGTSSPAAKLHVQNQIYVKGTGGGDGAIGVDINSGASAVTTSAHAIRSGGGGGSSLIIETQTANSSGQILFQTNGSERARIDSSGNLLVGTTTSGGKLTVTAANSTTPMVQVTNTTSGNAAGYASSLQTAANNTSSYHYYGSTLAVGNWYLYGNGTSSWSSDERLKKNITTARDGYLNDLCQLRVVKYQWKNGTDQTELGLIAQEVEQIFPGLVQEDLNPISPDDPTLYKQLKGSVLPFIMLKAIQEQQAIITQLQADVAALKGQA